MVQSNTERFLSLLESNDIQEVIKALQFLMSNPELSQSSHILLRLEKLAKSPEVAFRFWAKKILNETGHYSSYNQVSENQTRAKKLNLSQELPVEILVHKLQSVPSTFVSMDIIKKLCESQNLEALKFLRTYLFSCQDTIQISYLTKSIGIFYPIEDNIPTLIPFLKHSDDRVVANTIEGIEAIGSSKSVVIYSQMLEHKSNRVRSNAAKALASHNPEQAYLVIKRMLSSDGVHFRISACHAIKSLRDKKYFVLLEPLLHDDLLFPYALQAIEAIGGKGAVELITRLYSHLDYGKQEFCDETITRLVKLQTTSKSYAHKKTETTDNLTLSKYEQQQTPHKTIQTPEHDQDFIFCPKCGIAYNQNSNSCPKCNTTNPFIQKKVQNSNVKQKAVTGGIFCSSCGENIKKEAEICIHCGVRVKEKIEKQVTEQSITTPVTQKEVKKSSDEIYCPNCGKIVHKDAEICVNCGIRIKSEKIQEVNNDSRNRHSDEFFCHTCGAAVNKNASICISCGVAIHNIHSNTEVYDRVTIGEAVLWGIFFYPYGYYRFGQMEKGIAWLVIQAMVLVFTFGFGLLITAPIMYLDYFMSYRAQRNRKLGGIRFFPT